MKTYKINSLFTIFIIFLVTNVFSQSSSYPFDVQKTGKGKKAIIFIPGFASSGDVWNETKSKFENEYSCYTLTMAGFAGIKPQQDASFENWKIAIANFIINNKIEKPIIIGHSMGGALAMAIAADYPALPEKIIVVDALPCLAALMNSKFKATIDNDCSEILNQMTALSQEEFYQRQKTTIPRLVENIEMHEKVVSWSVQSDRKTFATMYCDFSNTDLREKIATIQCPSLILLESYFVNLKPAIEAQYKNLKTAQYEYANKGLHFIMYDDPEWYFIQLDNFISSK